ncbi:hypothetical protein PR048_020492 [Dryococelus australis]|uniref:Uncharacterized protein n=1 Tax=Dryococelus australis TaxID=614101 RepID=A0ABQ9H6F0_9NEOP|nr:hypothetical protein PR048_020492 [Dryococelus australis]
MRYASFAPPFFRRIPNWQSKVEGLVEGSGSRLMRLYSVKGSYSVLNVNGLRLGLGEVPFSPLLPLVDVASVFHLPAQQVALSHALTLFLAHFPAFAPRLSSSTAASSASAVMAFCFILAVYVVAPSKIHLTLGCDVMTESIVQDWLSDYGALSSVEVPSFASSLEHDQEVVAAIYNVLEERSKYPDLIDPVCNQLFSFYRSQEAELQRFTLQFLPTLIYVYLNSVAHGDKKRRWAKHVCCGERVIQVWACSGFYIIPHRKDLQYLN